MKISGIRKNTGVLALLLFIIPALSQAEERRQHEAHVHGFAHLDIAIEGKDIQLALKTPAVNVIGFEHDPYNEKELNQAKDAIEKLKNGEALLLFSSGASCKQVRSEVLTSMELAVHHNEEGHEEDVAHHHDGPVCDHDHHEGEVGEHHHGSHSDIDVSYFFQCEKPAELEGLELNFFKVYSGFQKIKVQIVDEGTQKGTELTPQKSYTKF